MSVTLIFSRDPGPTNYLIAVVERLKKAALPGDAAGLTALRHAVGGELKQLVIAARNPGEQMWIASGFPAQTWTGADDAAASELITTSRATVVLTGTSDIDEPGNHSLWRACERLGIESHAVLDHPSGMDRRFHEPDGSVALPSWIYVPDEVFAKRAEAGGLPGEKIRIIGDLHHERLQELAASRAPGAVEELRGRWGADSKNYVILFVSECGREMAAVGRRTGYDEVEILDDLLREIALGILPDGRTIAPARARVVVRSHPRDQPGKYDQVVAAHRDKCSVVITTEGKSDVALAAADLVVGMGSSMLYEAVALGRPAISLVGIDLSVNKSLAR